ncbi:hypothetical protein IWX49DRAFT_260481 [Phyllosticta citricarpa]
MDGCVAAKMNHMQSRRANKTFEMPKVEMPKRLCANRGGNGRRLSLRGRGHGHDAAWHGGLRDVRRTLLQSCFSSPSMARANDSEAVWISSLLKVAMQCSHTAHFLLSLYPFSPISTLLPLWRCPSSSCSCRASPSFSVSPASTPTASTSFSRAVARSLRVTTLRGTWLLPSPALFVCLPLIGLALARVLFSARPF